MILNKDIKNNENDNTVVDLKKSSKGIVSIGQVIANHQTSLLEADNEWEVEAIRLWHELDLSGDPSESFVKHIRRYFKKHLQNKLSIALSYCKDATKVRDREKLFYWRCANEPA